MKFGMPTLIENTAPDSNAALCRELGLQFVELNANLPQYLCGAVDVGKLRRIAAEYGIFYTLHLDENMNVSDFNPAVADAYVQSALDAIAMARDLEIPVLNMHLVKGVHFTLPDRKVYLFDEYRQQYLDAMARFRDRCREALGSSRIKICVENTDGYATWQIQALDVLLESEDFALTLDVGHNHCTGGADEGVIRQRVSRLRHIHLHDAVRPKRDHLTLGTGELDLQRYLDLAAENGCTVVLETKNVAALRSSVDWLKRLE